MVGILTIMSRIDFMLSWDEHEKMLYIFVAWSRGQRATESRKSSFDFQKK